MFSPGHGVGGGGDEGRDPRSESSRGGRVEWGGQEWSFLTFVISVSCMIRWQSVLLPHLIIMNNAENAENRLKPKR